jgi:hypothetical protein
VKRMYVGKRNLSLTYSADNLRGLTPHWIADSMMFIVKYREHRGC